MGTSQSNKGSPSNTPMVPPWTPDPLAPDGPPPVTPDGGQPQPDGNQPNDGEEPRAPEVPIAPRGRFGGARRNISDYAKTGNSDCLSRGLKHYSSKGMGGGKTAARRLGGTSKTAGQLYNALTGLSSQAPGQPPVFDKLDKNELQGRSAREIVNKVVEALSPTDGTQDSEARKRSIDNALSDLLTTYPDADLCNLDQEQVEYSVEAFAIEDLLRRFELDLGQTIIDNAPSVPEASKRLKDAKDFIREVARDSFREIKENNGYLNERNVKKIVNDALETTFDVFGAEE